MARALLIFSFLLVRFSEYSIGLLVPGDVRTNRIESEIGENKNKSKKRAHRKKKKYHKKKKKGDLPKMLAPTAEIKWLTSNARVGSVDVILEHFIMAAESIHRVEEKPIFNDRVT